MENASYNRDCNPNVSIWVRWLKTKHSPKEGHARASRCSRDEMLMKQMTHLGTIAFPPPRMTFDL